MRERRPPPPPPPPPPSSSRRRFRFLLGKLLLVTCLVLIWTDRIYRSSVNIFAVGQGQSQQQHQSQQLNQQEKQQQQQQQQSSESSSDTTTTRTTTNAATTTAGAHKKRLYDVNPVSYAPYNVTGGIPRQIFIFWNGRGFPSKSPIPNLARRTWEYMNPNYKVRALNTKLAEQLTNRSQYIPDVVWKQLKIQAKSDIYRTLLLNLHGGIWVDASTVCNEPLDDWINLNQTDLISFLRHDNKAEGLRTKTWPWITSWFLAAPKGSYMTQRLVDVFRVQTNPGFFKKRYYWWHHVVSQLSHQDAYIDNRIHDASLFHNADPMHCLGDQWETKAPVLKRCEYDHPFEHMFATFATTQLCCGDHDGRATIPATKLLQNNTSSRDVWIKKHCPTWDCHSIAANLHRVEDMMTLYGNETYSEIKRLLYKGKL